MTETSRIYFDGKGVDAPSGCAVIDALDGVNAEAAAAVRSGERMITDSRGLPTEPGALIYNGAIFRVIRSRMRDNAEPSDN